MPSLNTQLDQLYLSAQLPDEISFSLQQENASAEVQVHVDNDNVFSTTLFAIGHIITLYDIRPVIEQAIQDNYNICGICNITVSEQANSTTTPDFTVIISDFAIDNPANWLLNSFLTTRTSFLISRNGTQTLYWYSEQNEQISPYIEAQVLHNGEMTPRQMRWELPAQTIATNDIYSHNINVESIINHFQNSGKLLAFTVHRGRRAMPFFLTDELPSLTLLFLNAFNATEYAEIYAATTTKLNIEQSEAKCLRNAILYDRQKETIFETETAALLYEEAHWLRQLMTSNYVALKSNGSYRQILITDGNVEISDNNDDENRLKFSYKYARETQFL